jgi:ribonuclease VapC
MIKMLLDASAVLALLNREPGWEVVKELIPAALISAVNLAEVIGKLVDVGVPHAHACAAVEFLGLSVVEFDGEMAREAGRLRAVTRPEGLSLGDCACLATAIRLGVAVLTSDRSWLRLDLGVAVRCLRP